MGDAGVLPDKKARLGQHPGQSKKIQALQNDRGAYARLHQPLDRLTVCRSFENYRDCPESLDSVHAKG
jgi:hypothetical protein